MFLKRAIVSVLAAMLMCAAAEGAPIFVQTPGADFATLGAAISVGAPMVSDISGSHLTGNVISQAFTDGVGGWLYLYQVNNTGVAGSDVITRYTISPCTQADKDTMLGYLTANVPAAFSLGNQAPLYGDVNVEAGPTVGFNFPVGNPFFGMPNAYIAPGMSSKVLFIASDLAPGIITGNVINGGVHACDIIGPIPEPATMSLLTLGGLALIRRRTRVVDQAGH